MTYKWVEVRRRPTHIRIAFDRPDKRNALDLETGGELAAVLDEMVREPLPLVLTSTTPGMFMSGSDLAELASRDIDDALSRTNDRLFRQIAEHPWPTVAAVDGYALGGGGELALACDFRVSTVDAVWGWPEVTLGIIPGAGAIRRLPELIGRALARDLLMTGRRITGAVANDYGVVDRLAGERGLDHAVEELLSELSVAEPRAQQLIKRLLLAQDQSGLTDSVAQALSLQSGRPRERITVLLAKDQD